MEGREEKVEPDTIGGGRGISVARWERRTTARVARGLRGERTRGEEKIKVRLRTELPDRGQMVLKKRKLKPGKEFGKKRHVA